MLVYATELDISPVLWVNLADIMLTAASRYWSALKYHPATATCGIYTRTDCMDRGGIGASRGMGIAKAANGVGTSFHARHLHDGVPARLHVGTKRSRGSCQIAQLHCINYSLAGKHLPTARYTGKRWQQRNESPELADHGDARACTGVVCEFRSDSLVTREEAAAGWLVNVVNGVQRKQRTTAARAPEGKRGGGGKNLHMVPICGVRACGGVGTAPEHFIVAVRSHNGKAAGTTAWRKGRLHPRARRVYNSVKKAEELTPP